MTEEELLATIVREIADVPEAVRVTRTTDDMGVLLVLDVDASDMGKVIGKSGSNVSSLRHILRIVGMKRQARVSMRVNEPQGSVRSQPKLRDTHPDVARELDGLIADMKTI